MRFRPGGLWSDPSFVKLWSGATVSAFGSAFTALGFPLTAVLVLDATPAEMGLLGAVGSVPFLLVGLLAGAWVDRVRRRPVIVAADLGRAALLASIPVSAALGVLRIEQLYAVAFSTSVLGVFSSAAASAFLVSVVRRERLADANGKLEASRSVAETAGPGLAGVLVQALTAPVAIVLDAFSFVASALLVWTVRTPDGPHPPPTALGAGHKRQSIWREIGEGVLAVRGRPVLRAIAVGQGIFGFSSSAIAAVYVLYVTRELELPPAVFGAIVGVGNLGNLAAALLNGHAVRRWGLGMTMSGAVVITALASFLAPLAAVVPTAAVVPLLLARHLLAGIGLVAYMVNQVSLRQMSTPDRLQGRVSVTVRYVSRSSFPLGALAGGFVGTQFGTQIALVVGAFGMLAGAVWVLSSPVRDLQAADAKCDAADA